MAHNCHLSSRLPHEGLRDLMAQSWRFSQFCHTHDTHDYTDICIKKAEHLSGVIGTVVRDFAATVKGGEGWSGWDAIDLTDAEREIVERDKLVIPNIPPRRQAPLILPKPKTRLPSSGVVLPDVQNRFERRGEPLETLVVLLMHGQIDALKALIDNGLDLRKCLRAGYSNFFNGGLMHILYDNLLFVLVFNQLLLRDISPFEDLVEKFRNNYLPPLSLEEDEARQTRKKLASILYHAADAHDYRIEKESSAWAGFNSKLFDRTLTRDDLRAWSKLAFEAVYRGHHIMAYNAIRHAGRPATSLNDPKAPSPNGWPVEHAALCAITYLTNWNSGDPFTKRPKLYPGDLVYFSKWNRTPTEEE